MGISAPMREEKVQRSILELLPFCSRGDTRKRNGRSFEGSSHLGKERFNRYFFFLAAFFAGFLAAAFFAGFFAASFLAGFLAIDNPPFPCAVARRRNFCEWF